MSMIVCQEVNVMVLGDQTSDSFRKELKRILQFLSPDCLFVLIWFWEVLLSHDDDDSARSGSWLSLFPQHHHLVVH